MVKISSQLVVLISKFWTFNGLMPPFSSSNTYVPIPIVESSLILRQALRQRAFYIKCYYKLYIRFPGEDEGNSKSVCLIIHATVKLTPFFMYQTLFSLKSQTILTISTFSFLSLLFSFQLIPLFFGLP